MVKLALFVLPLGLDTFAASAALGVASPPARQRLKIGLFLASFETAMPLVGLLVGRGVGRAIGGPADDVAATVLVALAIAMVVADADHGAERMPLVAGNWLALAGLGLAVSLDELAMGFTIGLLHLSIAFAVALIGAQAFVVAQVGLRLGARIGSAAREGAERLAALALVGLAVLIVVERLTA